LFNSGSCFCRSLVCRRLSTSHNRRLHGCPGRTVDFVVRGDVLRFLVSASSIVLGKRILRPGSILARPLVASGNGASACFPPSVDCARGLMHTIRICDVALETVRCSRPGAAPRAPDLVRMLDESGKSQVRSASQPRLLAAAGRAPCRPGRRAVRDAGAWSPGRSCCRFRAVEPRAERERSSDAMGVQGP